MIPILKRFHPSLMQRTLWLFLLPALVLGAPAGGSKDIPRFQKVAEQFYRGGQPGREGFTFLKQQGVKTIINLREENDEEPLVRALGLNYVHLPMSVSVNSKIPEDAIEKYFQVLNDPANLPVFVHCRRGADRTGAMVGFYRIAVQGWDASRAFKEARDIGMRWWYPGLKDQLYNFKATNGEPFRHESYIGAPARPATPALVPAKP